MKRNMIFVAFALFAASACWGQISPESAFLTPPAYTNAFFGFSLPLPQTFPYHLANMSGIQNQRELFALAGMPTLNSTSGTLFMISAREMSTSSAEEVMKVSNHIFIGGRDFTKDSGVGKEGKATVLYTAYGVLINNYLVRFEILTPDSDKKKELERCVERITFFAPKEAKKVAGPNAQPFSPPSR